tara:strand:+ start:3462 stop:4412 length:951 start_codon:yes stop_codon:yes gene_type:complete
MSSYPNTNAAIASINQDFIDLSGCNIIDALPLDPRLKEILEKAISGDLFQNPLESLIQSGLTIVGDFAGEMLAEINSGVDTLLGEIGDSIEEVTESLLGEEGINILSFTDEEGLQKFRPESIAEFVERRSNQLTQSCEYFQQQTEILSGVSLLPKDRRASDFDYNSDGGIDDMPGITGISNIASGFNQARNSLDNPDELVDNFSEFFGSVAGPGSELFTSFTSVMEGDVAAAFAAFPLNADGGINFADNNALADVVNAYNAAETAIAAVEALINNERALALAAVEVLVKLTFGFSILALLADPCFGKILAEQVFNI